MKLSFKSIEGLVENGSFLTKYLIHFFGRQMIPFQCLNGLKGLVNVDLKCLNLFLVHFYLLLDWLLALAEPRDEDGKQLFLRLRPSALWLSEFDRDLVAEVFELEVKHVAVIGAK